MNTRWLWSIYEYDFYRAMQFSAKRGLAFACRPSARLSVTFVYCDHIGWKSRKTAQTISPTPSLFVAKRRSTYYQGKYFGETRETRGGLGKSGVLENKSGNISETRKDGGKVIEGLYRNSPTLFRTVPPPTPYDFPFPKMVGSQPRPPGIPVRELPGIPGNPPRQNFPAGIPGNYWVLDDKIQFWLFLVVFVKACWHGNLFSPFLRI